MRAVIGNIRNEEERGEKERAEHKPAMNINLPSSDKDKACDQRAGAQSVEHGVDRGQHAVRGHTAAAARRLLQVDQPEQKSYHEDARGDAPEQNRPGAAIILRLNWKWSHKTGLIELL